MITGSAKRASRKEGLEIHQGYIIIKIANSHREHRQALIQKQTKTAPQLWKKGRPAEDEYIINPSPNLKFLRATVAYHCR